MNKRSTIIASVLALVGVAVIWGFTTLQNVGQNQTVTFTFSQNTTSIKLFRPDPGEEDSKPEDVGSLTASGAKTLPHGSYYLIPSGTDLSSDPIYFDVTSDTKEVVVKPFYTSTYLAKTFSGDVAGIEAVISKKYPQVGDKYVYSRHSFYHYGDWFSTVFHDNFPEGREGVDLYGLILHKVGDNWEIVTTPEIVFSYAAYPDVPSDIIDRTNKLIADL